MIKISIINRTTKTNGEIRLRFRLMDGRKADMYHKSDIKASIQALEKFNPDGSIRKKVVIYDKDLAVDIEREINIMGQAYTQMQQKGLPMNGENFERVIDTIKYPQKKCPSKTNMLEWETRFDSFIQARERDGVFNSVTAAHYKVLLSILHRYLIIQNSTRMLIEDIDADVLMEFRKFMEDEYLYVSDWRHLYADMRANNIPSAARKPNTLVEKMKMLSSFFSELEDNDEIQKSPFRKLGKERKISILRERYDAPICLSISDFEKVRNSALSGKLVEVRDAFLLQCAFGCRLGDFKNLTMENVGVSPEGIPYIHYLPHKTQNRQTSNIEIQTPIMRFALEIIKAYQFNFPILKYPTGWQGYNAKIKELLRFCEIDRQCAIYNWEQKRNEYKPLYELASSKLARKTHVDVLNHAQVNKYAAGLHKEGSSAVDRYTKLDLQSRFTLMCYAFSEEQYKVDENLNIIS